MSEIGGYFQLDLPTPSGFCNKNYYAVNSCRNAISLLTKVKGYTKIFLPYYCCRSVIDTLIKNNIAIEHYHIDENLEIVGPIKQQEKHAMLYINYFGIKDKYIDTINKKYKNLIIDNAQSFFSNPIADVDSVYSPRKFLGVPDGGFLHTKTSINLEEYSQDYSYDRCSHLLKRIELDGQGGYDDFVKNEINISKLDIMKMSKLTKYLLSGIDYQVITRKRKENFNFIDKRLKKSNMIKIDLMPQAACLIYPYLVPNGDEIKQKLIENKIYVATYWKEVIEKTDADSFENFLTKHLVAIPIDQRYSQAELDYILKFIDA